MPDGELIDPIGGLSAQDPGHHGLALTPHSISVPCIDLMVARAAID